MSGVVVVVFEPVGTGVERNQARELEPKIVLFDVGLEVLLDAGFLLDDFPHQLADRRRDVPVLSVELPWRSPPSVLTSVELLLVVREPNRRISLLRDREAFVTILALFAPRFFFFFGKALAGGHLR